MFHPLRWLKEGMPLKGKVIIALLLLFIMAGGGYMSFEFYDFTQNNPKFCVSCHLMQPAFDAWELSEHGAINCHDCHHLSIPEQNKLLVNFVLYRPEKVPDRHGKIIVPWKYCIQCHWEQDKRYIKAKQINNSRMHAKHVFMEQIECAKCHGYITHKFTAEERFCIKCHKGKTVHGSGMKKIACLNCHTDRTPDLRPGPKKCLFCHGSKRVRDELVADGTLDVTHYAPDDDVINNAIKIDRPVGAAMQFYCYECHRPHQKARPDWTRCLVCHEKVVDVGKHKTHVQVMGLECKKCHKPHGWKVTPEQAKKDCVMCHDYKDPESFIRL
jgi:nitrate/TMAO reductase-like tetraheme cytochrome c subunit